MENQVCKSRNKKTRAKLLDKAQESNKGPGVYLMKDRDGKILYVGKAKNLKNRLQSYFQEGMHESSRTTLLVMQVADFDVILTETETEALILECTLIKKHRPKFNVRLKDDKAYPYLKIQEGEPFVRIEWTRRILKDGARYFGPFPTALAARKILNLLNLTFKLRDCSDNAFRHRSRPCILFEMNRCSAPCVGKVSEQDYSSTIQKVISILEGETEKFVVSLRQMMEEAAQGQEYERAAEIRDQIKNLEVVTAPQSVDEAGSHRNRDVVGLARSETLAHACAIEIRNGKMVAVKHFSLQNTDASLRDAQILFDFLAQNYSRKELVGEDVLSVREILLPLAPEEVELLEKTLNLALRVAETPLEEQLLKSAQLNAQYALEKEPKGHGTQALEEVQKKLHLLRFPYRIECFDISNLQGGDACGSRVVFINGIPEKVGYRRYKIKTVQGANDYAMLREVFLRRFSHPEEDLPDLVVVDGGKGQLSQVVSILEELSIQGVGTVGLAKARVERDFQAKEVKSSMERIFIPNRKNPVVLYPHTLAYKLLTHVRDEAHRFAISYHRKLRSANHSGSAG